MNPYDYYITPDEYSQASSIGVSNDRLERRIRLYGWSKHRALTTPIRNQKPPNYYREWSKLAASNGINHRTFLDRVNKSKWTPEKAATKPMRTTEEYRSNAHNAREKMRVIPIEYLRLSEQNGIPYQTFHRRVRRLKWDIERAATEPVCTRSECGKRGAKGFKALYSGTYSNKSPIEQLK